MAAMSALTTVRDLRPQAFGSKSPRQVREPIVEPVWPGIRVLAAVDRSQDGGTSTLLANERGERVADHAAIEAALAEAARAETLIVDGYLTKQVGHDGSGVYTGVEAQVSTGTLVAQGLLGSRRSRAAEDAEAAERAFAERSFGPSDVVALVATDVLWLDGEPLFDVPLLERKRLLESALDESDADPARDVRAAADRDLDRLVAGARLQRDHVQGRERAIPPGIDRRRLEHRVDASPLTVPTRQAGKRDGTVNPCPRLP